MTQWRILVVDDEPMNLEIIGDVLDDPAYAVSNAADGEIAWQAMLAAELPPHLVLLDRMMPVLDGIGLLKRIKADSRFSGIPVIMQSAAGSSREIAEGVAAGAWYYLPKPYAPRDLLTIVHAALADVEEREAAQHAVRNRRSVFELLDVAEFEFHTLKQAADLALSLAGLCPDPALAAMGLSELLVNAVEHGNLGIGYAEKSEMRRNDTWETEVEQRLTDPVLGARRVRVAFRRMADSLRFTIRDEGDGFDWRRYLDFDPQRAFDPNGRGIAMARLTSFASLDYLDCGNLVVATIPCAVPPGSHESVVCGFPERRADMTVQNVANQPPLKVLVVDDTATNRTILQVFLRKLGHEVVLAEDGAQAVAACEREAPDIVLMDVMMPVMDGYEATRRIKTLSAEHWIPVVFVSALDNEDSLVAGLDAGGDDYLPKPVNFVVLDAKLRSLARALALQRKLDEERQRAAVISDNLLDGVIVIDGSGLMQSCNPAVENMFGYARDEMIGQNVSMLMPEPYRSEHDGYLAHYVKGGQPRILGVGQREFRGRRKNGEVFPLDLGISEMRAEGRRQFVGVLHDASDRVAAQRQLRENAASLQAYHDTQQETNALAQTILSRQMQRAGLNDPSVRYWLAPAENFSGDIVAATRGPEGDLYVLLADATGHGLGAAICTLPVLSVFYSMAETGVALSWIVHEVNRQLQATLPVGHFVAASMLCIAADGRHADIWVGGTPDVLVLGATGEVRRRLASANLPLGVDTGDADSIAHERIDLQPGDQFVLFSDGLVEAENAEGQSFGYERLLAALASAAADRLDAVKVALARHSGNTPPHDDVSLMIVDCKPT
ncbi:MAG: response regulator [Sulfuritalea sp.]|nr:response regulator [Sulfuritalea sp.]